MSIEWFAILSAFNSQVSYIQKIRTKITTQKQRIYDGIFIDKRTSERMKERERERD